MNTTPRQQRTLAHPVAVEGFGYFSGLDIRVEFHPAAPDTGLVFVRRDLPNHPRLPVHVDRRVDALRRTSLSVGNASVEMIEHVCAALRGLQIDNCEVQVDRAEMPCGDGSSRMFVEALSSVATVAQSAPVETCAVSRPIRVGDEKQWLEAIPNPGRGLSIEYRLDYGDCPSIGVQRLRLEVTPDTFAREIGSARTFLLKREADWLRKQGLGNRVTYENVLVFTDAGPLGNKLRFPDECVRHKILDVIGDLALLGCELEGNIIACRSGHQLNAELVRELLAQDAQSRSLRDCA